MVCIRGVVGVGCGEIEELPPPCGCALLEGGRCLGNGDGERGGFLL